MLKVWLPLDGDLRNLGASNIEVVNNGATVNDSGKIGKCYYFDGTTYIKETTYDWTNFNTSTFSLCCWYKEPSPVANGNSQMICIGTSSGWNDIRIGLLRRTSNGYPLFSVSDGTNNVNYNCTAASFSLDTWNHIACTYNNGEIKIYLNGILNKTYTTTITAILNSSQHLGIGAASNGAEKLTGYLNDVRIYDHCLSAAEVHEIAMGLVLHYKLDGGVTVAKNLIKNGYGELNSINWESASNISSEIPPNHPEIKKSFYSNAITEYISIESTHSYKLEAYLKNTATSGNTYPSLYPYDIDKKFIATQNCQEGFNLSTMTTLTQQLKSGDTKIYVNSLANWNANSGHYYNTAAIFSYKDNTGHLYPDGTYTQNVPRFGNGTNAKTNLDKTNNIITLNSAYTGPTMPIGTSICAATDGSTYYYPFGGLTKSSLNNWTYKTATMIPNNIARLKYAKYIRYATYDNTLHAGIKLIDLADDIDSTIVSDSSGYGHNGTINGTLTTSSDTAKYTTSSYFGEYNTPSITLNNPTSLLPALTNCTITWWGKYDTTRTLLLTGQTTSYYIAASDNNNYYHGSISSSSPTMYKDGVAGTYKCAADGWHFFCVKNVNLSSWTALKINSYSSYWSLKGLISDFRIYCTPLLDTDIKLLYNVSMKVDNLGEIHSFEFKEAGGRELLGGVPLTTSYSNHENIYTNYTNGEIKLTGSSSISTPYIEINPTGKTYYWDAIITKEASNVFYLGFERYDANKTARSNNATNYVIGGDSTAWTKKHVSGTVNLSTDGVNACKYITLRILNDWSSANNRTAIIHQLSLREISTVQKQSLNKNGILLLDELKEDSKVAFYKNGFVEATEFIEK